MNLIKRIKESLKRGYYCNCHERNHHKPNNGILGLVGAFIGCAIMLDGLPSSIDEKKYCTVCHP